MSENQEIPKGTIAIAIVLILLFLIQIIVEIILRSEYESGMANYYWAIGGTTLILGIIILLNVYRKYKSRRYIKKLIPGAIVSGEEQLVTDEDMRKAYKKSIALFFIGWIMAAASAPFLASVVAAGNLTMVGLTFAMGIAFGLIGTYFIIIYKTKPEKYLAILTKRKKRKMKKKT